MTVEYQPLSLDNVRGVVELLNDQGLGKALQIQLRKPAEDPEVGIRELLTCIKGNPRWQEILVAESVGQVVGMIHYSVDSTAFLGGNDYKVYHVLTHPSLSADEAAMIDQQLRKLSAEDDADI